MKVKSLIFLSTFYSSFYSSPYSEICGSSLGSSLYASLSAFVNSVIFSTIRTPVQFETAFLAHHTPSAAFSSAYFRNSSLDATESSLNALGQNS